MQFIWSIVNCFHPTFTFHFNATSRYLHQPMLATPSPPHRSAGSSQPWRKEVSECCANWSQCWKPPETTACEKSLTDEWWKLHVAQSKWEPETFSTDFYYTVIQPIMSWGNTSPQKECFHLKLISSLPFITIRIMISTNVKAKEVRHNPPILLQSYLL